MRHQRVGDTGTDQGKGQRGGSRGRVSNILTDSRFVHRTGFLRTRTRTRTRARARARAQRSGTQSAATDGTPTRWPLCKPTVGLAPAEA